jgi:hypothetical protein
MCSTSINAKNSAFCPHIIFTCLVWISQTAYMSLNVGQDSSIRIVTRYGPDGEIFCTHLDQSWSPLSLLYNGYIGSFPGVERLGCGVDHPHTSNAKVTVRVELYVYSLWAFLSCSRVHLISLYSINKVVCIIE